MSALNNFLRNSRKPEIYPLFGILTFALSGAGFFMYRAARAPDVSWDHKSNPYPWQDIKDGEQVKLMTVNHTMDRRWDRTKW
ncbi:NADH-ubiquinone reductase complex 1 MLRQ subunit-domain-containing protein [Sporodiniella umbellata]|nr:NADH-ubiquinone reductase complex 1 MLRQ subunit-domain-containing protein [Sporodiniella umbellata]